MSNQNPDYERFVQLSWQILEHKCYYYVLSKPIISDYEYDLLEKEYEALADKLKLPRSASDMVDFDANRPSCQRVMEKICPVRMASDKKKRRR
jgi:NAD-dependent DNA ligase